MYLALRVKKWTHILSLENKVMRWLLRTKHASSKDLSQERNPDMYFLSTTSQQPLLVHRIYTLRPWTKIRISFQKREVTQHLKASFKFVIFTLSE